MKAVSLLGLLLCLGFSSFASADLREELRQETTQAHRVHLDYSAARKILLGQLHLQQGPDGYFIRDVYCQKDYTESDFQSNRGPAPGQAPDDHVLNVEHTWPQSKFSGREAGTMKTDLHHLFPSDSELNSIRGNHKFGEVDDSLPVLKCNQTQIGKSPNGGGLQFEPPAVHKGNVARALFYFAVRYGLRIDDDQEADLRVWNKNDPPDDFERSRNDAIEKIQGNRNPFIDHPDYVDQIENF